MWVGPGVDEVTRSGPGAMQDAGVIEVVVVEAADGVDEVADSFGGCEG